jgi:hypothetical protein
MEKPTIDIAAGKEVILTDDEKDTVCYVTYAVYGTPREIREIEEFFIDRGYNYAAIPAPTEEKEDHNGFTSAIDW